jgi:hypothetical protein
MFETYDPNVSSIIYCAESMSLHMLDPRRGFGELFRDLSGEAQLSGAHDDDRQWAT